MERMKAMTMVVPIPPGAWVLFQGEPWRLAGYNGTGQAIIHRSGRIQPLEVEAGAIRRLDLPGVDFTRLRPFSTYTAADQEVAIQRSLVIEAVLQAGIAKDSVIEGARQLGVSPQSLRRYLNLYMLSGGQKAALVPRVFRYGVANHRLSPELEEIIAEAISAHYYSEERKPLDAVFDYVERECDRRSLGYPSEGTIRQRIARCPPREVALHRYGRKKARETFDGMIRRRPDAGHPLAKIEIDHTRLNILIRCRDGRLRRPWITIAMDDYSRAVIGIYISFDPPCWLSVALCLYRVMTDKTEWLKAHGIDYPWPCHGLPGLIQADSGEEFSGSDMDRASLDFDFIVQHRLLAVPEYGGRIERIMGAAAYAMEFLRGKTFRSVTDKEDYDSAKYAVLTKEDLEWFVLVFFVGRYNNTPHRSLRNRTPLNRWKEGVQEMGENGLHLRSPDPSQLMRLLPAIDRTVRKEGVEWESILYQSSELIPYRKTRNPETIDGKYWFHYNPHDIRYLYMRRPGGSGWIEIPAKNLGSEPESVWERTDKALADRLAAKDEEAEARAKHARMSLLGRTEEVEALSIKEHKKNKREKQARKNRGRTGTKSKVRPEVPTELSNFQVPEPSGLREPDTSVPDWTSLPRVPGRYL